MFFLLCIDNFMNFPLFCIHLLYVPDDVSLVRSDGTRIISTIIFYAAKRWNPDLEFLGEIALQGKHFEFY